MAYDVNYAGNTTTANPHPYPSQNIWGDCPFLDLASGVGGWAFHEEFFFSSALTNATTGTRIAGPISAILSTDSTVTNDTALPHSMRLLSTSDNEIAAWVLGQGSSASTVTGQTIRIAYNTTKFWFETRMKMVTCTDVATFIGLLGKAGAMQLAASNLDDNTGAPDNEDVNFIGFNSICASATTLNAMYLKEDESAQTNVLAAAHTYVADTFVKLGLHFDGRFLRYYVDGVQVGSVQLTSSTVPTTFPDQSVGLTLAGIVKNGSTDDEYLTTDWIRAAYVV